MPISQGFGNGEAQNAGITMHITVTPAGPKDWAVAWIDRASIIFFGTIRHHEHNFHLFFKNALLT